METSVKIEKEFDYKKGFLPFAFAAVLVSLVGGFTAPLPATVVGELGADPAFNTWMVLTYAFGAASCAPILGKLSDVIGRRGTLILGITVLGLGAIICAIAPNIIFILIGRFIVGVGAAAIAPTVIGYITSTYPPSEMAKGFTLYMALSTGAVIFGPAVGGVILQYSDWRMVFWVCAALAATVLVLVLLTMKKTEVKTSGLTNFDITGGIFIFIFFSLALCIPSFGQSNGWTNPMTLITIGAAIISGSILVINEKKAKNPILNGKFMARKEFILPVLVLFLTQGLMQAVMTNTIIFVRFTNPSNTLVASLAISVMYIGMTLGTIFIGPMADKKEPRYLSAFTLLFCMIGAGIQYLFRADSGFIIFASALFLVGIGLGGNATIFMKVVLSGLSQQDAGAGSGTYSVFRDLSAPFGVALFVPMFVSAYTLSGNAPSSLQTVAIVQVVCVAIGIGLCLMLPKIHGQKSAS